MSDTRSIHVWQQCHGCGAAPIVGRRHDCLTCPTGPETHLCDACHEGYRRGTIRHPPRESARSGSDVAVHEFHAVDPASTSTCEPWLRVPDRAATPPDVPDGFVVRPEFCTGKISFMGSYGFAATLGTGSPRLVVTALHVLDELARHLGIDCSLTNAAYTGEELPGHVREVHLYDVFAPVWMFAHLGAARAMLVLREARTGEQEPACQRDVAAFLVDDPGVPLRPGRFATRAPAVGEPIWLTARGTGDASVRTMAATVVECTADTLIFRFDIAADRPRFTSGAPLLNRRGEIVGINLGGGWVDGRRYGHATHVMNIRRQLESPCAMVAAGTNGGALI